MVVALGAIPVLLSQLGSARFGILSLAWTVVGYFGLFDMGLGRSLTQMVSERLGTERSDEVPGLVWTGLLLLFTFGLLELWVRGCWHRYSCRTSFESRLACKQKAWPHFRCSASQSPCSLYRQD